MSTSREKKIMLIKPKENDNDWEDVEPDEYNEEKYWTDIHDDKKPNSQEEGFAPKNQKDIKAKREPSLSIYANVEY